MFLTIFYSLALIALGLTGFLNWDQLGASGTPAEMLMPVFFGGTLLICLAFSREHFRHGLYGELIIAMLGVISAIIRLYQYGLFTTMDQPKTQFIVAMAIICVLQFFATWKKVQADRAVVY